MQPVQNGKLSFKGLQCKSMNNILQDTLTKLFFYKIPKIHSIHIFSITKSDRETDENNVYVQK